MAPHRPPLSVNFAVSRKKRRPIPSSGSIKADDVDENSPKALAIATLPSTAMIGTNTIDEPRSEHISTKDTSRPSISVPNGGGCTLGKPSLKENAVCTYAITHKCTRVC